MADFASRLLLRFTYVEFDSNRSIPLNLSTDLVVMSASAADVGILLWKDGRDHLVLIGPPRVR